MLTGKEIVKDDSQEKNVGKRGYEYIAIRLERANGNNIQVRKNRNKEEKDGEKDDLRPSKREDAKGKKGECDKE